MYHVLLDTEPFLRENLHFSSKRFLKLAELAQQQHVTVYVTTITVEEVRHAINETARAAVKLLKPRQTKRTLGVLAQLESAKLSGVIAKLDAEKLIAELHPRFDQLLASLKAETISVDRVAVDELCRRYFEVIPPFGYTERKKHEFPDAIIVLAAEEHARSLGAPLYVVSADKGVTAAASSAPGLESMASLSSMISRVMETTANTAAVATAAEQALEIRTEEVLERVSLLFLDSGFYVEDQWDGEVEDVEVVHAEASELSVAEVEGNRATVEFFATIEFSANVTVDDPAMTAYDSETKQAYAFGRLEKRIVESAEVEGAIAIEVDLDSPRNSRIISVELAPGSIGVEFPWADQ